MKEYIKPNIKVCEVSSESLLAGSLDAYGSTPSDDTNENQFSKKKGPISLWDYEDGEEEEENE